MTAATDDETQGRLTRDKLDAVLADIGVRVGIDVRDAELIKFTNNAVFRLTRAPVVIRIAGSETMRSRVSKVVRVARWLAEQDAPAVRLLSDVPQPLYVRGHLVTLWWEVPSVGPKPTGRDLAGILGRLHALPSPSFGLPPWRPLDEIRQRLGEQEGLDTVDLVFVLRRCDALVERGHEVVAYVRSPQAPAAQALVARGARLASGDLANGEALARAAAGTQAMFALSVPFGEGGKDEEAAQGRLLVDTAGRLGVHLIYSSVRGADRVVDSAIGHVDSKQLVEEYLREQDVRATVLGPSNFMENALNLGFSGLRDGVFTNPLSPARKLDQVTVLDIAGVAVHAIENPDDLAGKRIDLASDCITGEEAAQVLSDVLGREIPYRQLPLQQVRNWAGDEIADMFQSFEDNTDFLDLAALRAQYPAVQWHSYADWAKTVDWDRVLAG